MISTETWQAFGGLLVVLIALGGAAVALQRLGIIRRSPGPAPAPAASEGEDGAGAARMLALEGRISSVEGRASVLEERTRKHERSLEGIGRLHARIDGVAETTGRIEGEITQMNRTLQLMLRHLLGEGGDS